MDKLLDDQLQRVETALNTLIDSITTYNPSVTVADNLVTADEELSRGLEQLAQHQANYSRILQLRQTAELLDAQIKSTVQVLADARKELISMPFTSTPTSARDVPFEDLLAYAKKISLFTVPPTFRPAPPKLQEPEKPAAEAEDTVMATGTPRSPLAAAVEGGVPAAVPDNQEENRGVAFAQLSEEQKNFVEEVGSLPFVPWPHQDLLKQGGLAKLQEKIEQGFDPLLIAHAEDDTARERRALEESEEAKRVQEARKPAVSRSGAVPAAPREQPVSQAKFGFNDDDDDD